MTTRKPMTMSRRTLIMGAAAVPLCGILTYLPPSLSANAHAPG